MAGSASNWFKPSSGPLKGQAVYLSRDQQARISASVRAGVGAAPASGRPQRDLIERILGRGDAMASPASRLAQQLANTGRPAGVARTAQAPGSSHPGDAFIDAWGFGTHVGFAGEGLVTVDPNRAIPDVPLGARTLRDLDRTLRASQKALLDAPVAHRTALALYQDGEFTAMNDFYWKGKTPKDRHAAAGLAEQLTNLEALFANPAARLPDDLTLVRKQSKKHPIARMIAKMNVGDAYDAKGAESSSFDPGFTWPPGEDVVVTYRARKGQNAIVVNAVTVNGHSNTAPLRNVDRLDQDNPANPDAVYNREIGHARVGKANAWQHEVLFAPGTQWRMTKKERRGTQWVVEMELAP